MSESQGVKKEMDVIREAIRTDPGYRIGWVANIAVQFQDAWQKAVDEGGLPCTPEQIHKISNEAAENFITLLTRRTDQ
jgi:hypothetical protein